MTSLFASTSAHPCDDDPITESGACFSTDRRFRYNLWRRWASGPAATFLMLNPSLADERDLDPTLRRCFGFAQRLGCGTMFVTNVFPLVSPYPKDLLEATDRDGEPGRNIDHLRRNLERSKHLIVAFGGWPLRRDLRYVLGPIRKTVAQCALVPHALLVNSDGSPRHPLYVSSTRVPTMYEWPVEI